MWQDIPSASRGRASKRQTTPAMRSRVKKGKGKCQHSVCVQSRPFDRTLDTVRESSSYPTLGSSGRRRSGAATNCAERPDKMSKKEKRFLKELEEEHGNKGFLSSVVRDTFAGV